MKKMIKIYGERNTNTNYLRRLIELNLDARQIQGVAPQNIMRLQRIFPGQERVKDLYFLFTYKNNLGWKHSYIKEPRIIKRCRLDLDNLNFITITKNPYSWLLSLHRNSYHQYYKEKPGFEEFLKTPWKTVGRENYKNLMSPVELWNIKNSSYFKLSSFNCINITTESLFSSPESIINEINTTFSIKKLSSEFINFEKSTKNSKKDSAYYQDYYLKERWRNNLTKNSIAIINEKVDKSLMHKFGYNVLSENE